MGRQGVRSRAAVLVAVACAVVSLSTVAPGAATSLPGKWKAGLGLQGAGATVLAVAVSGTHVYIGGTFTTFGGRPSNYYSHVAEWNGSSWKPLGTGVNGQVTAITVLNGKVFVGGTFTSAGGVSANDVAEWDGSAWSDIGGVSASEIGIGSARVEAMTNDGTSVYLGGVFDHAGTLAANSVVAYTPGTGYANVGTGVLSCGPCGATPTTGEVKALTFGGGRLWAGGYFSSAGSSNTSSFASWDGASWSTYGAGLTVNSTKSTVESVAFDASTGVVYVGGKFNTAGSVPAVGVAALTSGAWSNLGNITANGNPPDVYGLTARNGVVDATGSFSVAGAATARDLAELSGGTWSEPAGGLDLPGYAAAVYGTAVVVAGQFDLDATKTLNLGAIGVLTQSRWHTLGQGVQSGNSIAGAVKAVLGDGATGAYVGGVFNQVGQVRAAGVAHWTGTAWKALATGVTSGANPGTVTAMADNGGDLYVAGNFDHAASVGAADIARWDGRRWHAMAAGLPGPASSLAFVNGKLYAAGTFSGAAAGTLRVWDPATSTWSAAPDNPVFSSGSIYALASYQDRYLVVGGSYTHVADSANAYFLNGLVLLDTQSAATGFGPYSTPGGTDGAIYALDTTSDALYVGGHFTQAGVGGPNPSVAAANVAVLGSAWAPLAAGTNGDVLALTTNGTHLYATGNFTHAGTVAAAAIAAFDTTASTWTPLSGGGLVGTATTVNPGQALAADATGVWIGGQFVQSGSAPSGSFARFDPS
jgi:hypothetical protein